MAKKVQKKWKNGQKRWKNGEKMVKKVVKNEVIMSSNICQGGLPKRVKNGSKSGQKTGQKSEK